MHLNTMVKERHQTHSVFPSSSSQDAPVHSYPPNCHPRPIISVTQHQGEFLGMPSEPSSACDAPIRIHSLPLPSASTLPGNNTRPRYRISCYRLVSAVSVVAFGVPKAIAAYQNAQVTATTLDWISGISLSLFIMVAGWWEQDPPSCLKWFFDTDWTPRKPNWEVYRHAAKVLSECMQGPVNFVWAPLLILSTVLASLCGAIWAESWITNLGECHSTFETVVLWYQRVSTTVILLLYLLYFLRRRCWISLLGWALMMVQILSYTFKDSVFHVSPFIGLLPFVLLGLVVGSVMVLIVFFIPH
ncbi:hypothetical protein JAAARDRAFT_535740 [Jaapia argillacea MUCL 33604]|uniref:Transmembrane protein n=1 Tax=Jaapia argillacea MUCL 33604 TaxID=933084 RepID=A0A067P8L3_9AGAM|nr:hypothetical protein JAAARDRAFT_535740 [Jaapia argillacea MUCL 33604]